MSSKITLGLVLSALGMLVSLGAPIIHIALVSSGIGSILGVELTPGFPLHLLLSIAGVPLALSGLFLFRRGVREELSAERMVSLERESVIESFERRGLLSRENEEPVLTEKPSDIESVRRGIKVKSAGLSLICPDCGAEASISETGCSNCGGRFNKSSDPLKACPICGADLSTAKKLDSDTYVCSICFSELEIDQQTAKRIFV
ncbi:MAG: hypothetical protein RMJ28_05435 [Nitrososphaerota archaeon]|nr:hypothetical protein [Candidatus Calditenuaceae archaeon]MDW8073657.1 hypothetical protein [Nitrososphaerota archaeon]